jgi:hypothetical protein
MSLFSRAGENLFGKLVSSPTTNTIHPSQTHLHKLKDIYHTPLGLPSQHNSRKGGGCNHHLYPLTRRDTSRFLGGGRSVNGTSVHVLSAFVGGLWARLGGQEVVAYYAVGYGRDFSGEAVWL